METLTITITKSSDDDGYFYDIYDCEPSEVDNNESLEGGQCTTTLANALEMAYEQAKTIINNLTQAGA